jgi:hypothetical protein
VDSFVKEFKAKMMFTGAAKQGKIKLLNNGMAMCQPHTKV